jgi:hypothetical protein
MTHSHTDKKRSKLEIIFQVASIIGVAILFWYTYETNKLRLTAQQQLKYTARPFVALIQSNPEKLTIANKSNNVATNIFLMMKNQGQYYILQEDSISAGLTPNTEMSFATTSFTNISEDELLKKFSYLKFLVKNINEKEITNNIIIVYEDLLRNKLFSIIYGKGGTYTEAIETRYLDELEN